MSILAANSAAGLARQRALQQQLEAFERAQRKAAEAPAAPDAKVSAKASEAVKKIHKAAASDAAGDALVPADDFQPPALTPEQAAQEPTGDLELMKHVLAGACARALLANSRVPGTHFPRRDHCSPCPRSLPADLEHHGRVHDETMKVIEESRAWKDYDTHVSFELKMLR